MEARELLENEEMATETATNGVALHREEVFGGDCNAIVRNEIKTAKKVSKSYLIAKRSFDIFFALCGSVVLLIPILILALIIVSKDFGNPFYFHKRVGKNGKDIWVAKLRSMKNDANDLESVLSLEKIEEYHREYKLDDDPRLIGWKKANDGQKCFGAMLRRTSMDEVPQIIWNILIKGDMSVVGPRPILHEELIKNYTPEEQAILLSVKPGLTGYWQAYARNKANYATSERQRMELYYAENRSPWLDVKIIFATVGAVIRKNGAK